MKKITASIVVAALLVAGCSKKNPAQSEPYIAAPADKDWAFEATPTWADEFDYTGAPDASKWGYDIGGNGWGNNELQYYTNSVNNARVENGKLIITAKREPYLGKDYTSARLITKDKADFLYGRFEAKAKLPPGRGTWPAIWMLPTEWAYGDWPKSGEIDIMEHVGYNPNVVHISTHTEAYNHTRNTEKTATKLVDNAMTEFNVYRVDWTPYAIRGYINGVQIFEHINEGKGYATYPFDKKFHFLLNIAVGGNWGGFQGVDETVFPASMEVEYVRVYKMIP